MWPYIGRVYANIYINDTIFFRTLYYIYARGFEHRSSHLFILRVNFLTTRLHDKKNKNILWPFELVFGLKVNICKSKLIGIKLEERFVEAIMLCVKVN
jgi:hypothetical protein